MEDDDRFDDLPESERRLGERFAALGTRTPRCSHPGCGETDPFALSGAHPHILCAEHRADRDGRSWTEAHHWQGQANDPADVTAIPANDHAVLSNKHQPQWPRETLRNPGGSPLLQAAAALRGWLDALRLILERTVGWIPTLLELLDAYLGEVLGLRWGEGFWTWLRRR